MASNNSVGKKLMLIGGEWVEAENKESISVENPAHRGASAGEVPRGGASDVNRAVTAAAKAFPSWKNVPARERGKILLKIVDDIEMDKENLAWEYSLETGNPINGSRGEVMTTADLFRYFGGVSSELKGETLPLGNNLFSYTKREPFGVVGGIIPWNSPIVLAALKITMALTSGNTLVLKPSVEAPLTVLSIAKICSKHLPDSVLNVVTGNGTEVGEPLLNHPLVNKISFTGSTDVGKTIAKAASDRIIPVSIELGGKSPQIVFPDSDDDATVQGVFNGMRFPRSSQSCTAGSRLFLHESIHDSFLEKLVAKIKQIKIGEPLDETTQMGTIVNRNQWEKVCHYIEDGLNQPGANLLIGGLPEKSGPLSEGYYVEPTIFTNVNNDWRIAKEEIFGPVLVVIPWKDEADVIRMANDSHYGLAAFVYSKDINKALKTADSIDSGFVWINQGGGILPGHSYGGMKQSGLGREWSLEGMLDNFTQRKTVTIQL